MVEIVGHLTKMRFGEQDQSKAKDTKEVNIAHFFFLFPSGLCLQLHVCVCVCVLQPTGGIYARLETQFKGQVRQSSEKTPRYPQQT